VEKAVSKWKKNMQGKTDFTDQATDCFSNRNNLRLEMGQIKISWFLLVKKTLMVENNAF